MIDAHAHLNFKVFDKDRAQVIGRSFNNGIKKIINVGAQLETSKKAIEITNQFENVYAAVGLHPIHAGDEPAQIFRQAESKQSLEAINLKIRAGKNFDYEIYKKLAQNKKVVAIGETGLDYFHITDPKLIILQKEIFLDHIRLAQELDLPLILHCRGSKNDPDKPYLEMLQILSDKKARKGVIHCFSSNMQIAEKFLEKNFYIGFTGIITFVKEMEDVVKKISLDKILTETDCPYLAPAPYRGQRSEPWHVKFVIKRIAEIKSLSYNKMKEQTIKNAAKLFKFT